MKTYVGSGAVLVLALFVMIFQPFGNALSLQSQLMLGGILITFGIWIFKPFNIPFSVGAMFLGCFGLAVGLPPSVVFSGFTQSAVWTLIAALFFGFALQKTGLGYRIALAILRLFKPSYISLVLAWAIIGLALSVLTPSITVRVAIVIPIAVNCCELCHLKPGSKGNSLIMLTAFAMAMVPGGGWMNGALAGPIIHGAYESVPELAGMLTFDSWMSVSLAPVEIATALMLIGSLILFKPKEPLPAKAINAIKSTRLEPISMNEIITAAILIGAFILFFTGSIHNIPSTAVCLGATFLLFAFGIIKVDEIGTGVNWDNIIFIGIALGLGTICSATGITEWISGLIVPALTGISNSPFLFVGVIAVVFFAWRMIDIANFMTTFILIPAMLPAINARYGVHPLVFVPMLYLASNAFFMNYQNSWALMGQAVARKRSWTPGHLAAYGTIYFAASIISLMIMVPFWVKVGMFG
ncbi:MAG TPA: hypothetical protein GXZ52_03670 [Clostridiales bacterium]|nr:hypothetical protein [Clostridiales bacterium]